MSLSFRDHRFEPPKYSVDDCKDRDVTYAAPLFVTAEFMNNETGEIKSQTVFMGDFPLMTTRARSSSTAPSVSSCPSSFGRPASTSSARPTRRPTRHLHREGHPVARCVLEFEIDNATWSAYASTASASRAHVLLKALAGPKPRSSRSSASTSRSA